MSSHRWNDRGTWLFVLLGLFGAIALLANHKQPLKMIAFDAPISDKSGFINVTQLLDAKINLNEASFEQLKQIPKLRSNVALGILEARKRLGKFSNYNEIDEIKGVGVKTLEVIRRHTVLKSETRP